MRHTGLMAVLLALSASASGVADAQQPRTSDRDLLQGKWVATRFVTPKAVLTGEKAALFSVTFGPDRATVARLEKKYIDGRFALDVDANPRRIEIFTVQEGKKVVGGGGIYSLRGDTLTLRLIDPDRFVNPDKLPPPEDFENIPQGDPNDVLLVLRRAEARVRGPQVRDEAGFWSEDQRARMNEAIGDLSRRLHCKVFIETYARVPAEMREDVDLRDRAVKDRIVWEWAVKRCRQLSGSEPGVTILILTCKEIDWYKVRTYWKTVPGALTKEESEQVKRLVDEWANGLYRRLNGRVARGMPEALDYLGDACQTSQDLIVRSLGATARPPVAMPAPVLPPQVLPPERERPQATEQPPARESDGNSAADREAFTSAALAAGLSDADVNALLEDRGPASYRDLADFLNDQVKDGRRGADLKKDLEVFIRVFKEKVGK